HLYTLSLHDALPIFGSVRGPNGTLDAGAHRELLVADLEGLDERLRHSLRGLLDLGGAAHVREHDRELVAAEAGHGVSGAHPVEQARGGLAEKLVAHRVAALVVDRLEAAAVHGEAAERRLARAGAV